jgi:hypothetical protein
MKRWIPVLMLICVASGSDRALAGDKSELVGNFYIDKSWWPEFDKPVTIAATSFLQIENGGISRNRFLVWLQEMKAPPVEQLIKDSAKVVPMRSADWQARQNNPDTLEVNPEDGKYQYDGSFKANQGLLGTWTVVGKVASKEVSQANAAKVDPKSIPFTSVTFKDGGETDIVMKRTDQ